MWPYGRPVGFAPPAHLILTRHRRRVRRRRVAGGRHGDHGQSHRRRLQLAPHRLAPDEPAQLRQPVGEESDRPITIGGVQLSAMGQGPGMLGLPGDSSSPARFVHPPRSPRRSAPWRPVPNSKKTALHILATSDIPFGFVRDDDDPSNDDHTLWSTVSSFTDRRYVIRSYDSPVPRSSTWPRSTSTTQGPARWRCLKAPSPRSPSDAAGSDGDPSPTGGAGPGE